MSRPVRLAGALAGLLVAALHGAGARAQGAANPAPASAASAPMPEGQRIDDRRPERPRTVEVFGHPVQLTGSWEASHEQRRNFDLDTARQRDRRVLDHEVKLEARTRPNADTEVFVQAVGLQDTRRTQGTEGPRRSKSLERGQTWVKFDRLGGSPWSLQLGRVALIDRRAWWWDDDLDAMRVRYEHKDWSLDTGLSRQLARVSSDEAGIPAADQGNLFTRFFRASNAMRDAIPGSGLGLSIVKQIVQDQHGGEVRLVSIEGEGTTVVIDLPLYDPRQTQGAAGNGSEPEGVSAYVPHLAQ